MTEELPGQDMKSSSQSVEMSDLPSDPVPAKVQESSRLQQMPKPIRVFKDQDDNSTNITELLKQNNGEDIEVVFYSNKKLIDKSTSFYEICKEPTAKSASDE